MRFFDLKGESGVSRVEKILENYYSKGKENNRLTEDKAHMVEFLTTVRYIDKYLKKGDKILDIGAGTGIYSLYYAKKGYKIDAIELTNSNIKELKKNIKKEMNIDVEKGNALDLSKYRDNTFDITLLLRTNIPFI